MSLQKTKMLLILAIVIVVTTSGTFMQAEIIPAGRRIAWSLDIVGVPGGIPNRTTIFTTIDAAVYGNGTTDAAAVINTAIQNCPANQVVYLPAGTYLVKSPIYISKSNITLRGAGMGKTKILGQNATGIGDAIIYTKQMSTWDGGVILAGSAKGLSKITVDDASKIASGKILRLYQANDTDFIWSRVGAENLIKQRVIVTAVKGQEVEFSPPLVWTLNITPRWGYAVLGVTEFSGIEDLTIEAGSSNKTNNNLWFDSTYACWIKNVESVNCNNVHFLLTNSLRGEIRGSYMHDTSTFNEGYGMQFYAGQNDAAAFLIEDNIATNLFAFGLFDILTGSVIAYNFAWDINNKDETRPWQVGAFGNHGPHGMMNLYEGNVGQQFQSDGYHGSSSHDTLFRNWFNGLHSKYTLNRKMIDLCRYSYYYNIVGNILGSAEWAAEMYEMTGNGLWYTHSCIYRLGYPHMGNNDYNEGYPPCGTVEGGGSDGKCGLDPKVKATLLRHGNYDYQTKSTIWDPSIADHALPASLYLTSKPAWFGNVPWPPIGSDVPGLVNKIPAQIRFEGGGTSALNLSSGWNWISFNVLPIDNSPNSVFSGILTQVEQVKSQTQSAIRSNGNWKGDLPDMSGIGQYKMYKVKVNAACTLTVTGTTITPTTSIPLQTGWNWVAFLPTTSISITAALDSIKGQVLQVKSLTQSATYNGTSWSGLLTQLDPGQGYAIKMSIPGTLTYPGGQ